MEEKLSPDCGGVSQTSFRWPKSVSRVQEKRLLSAAFSVYEGDNVRDHIQIDSCLAEFDFARARG